MSKTIYFMFISFLLASCSTYEPVSTGLVDALERIGTISGYSEYQNTNKETDGFDNAVKDERLYLSDALSSAGSITLKKAGFVTVDGDDRKKIALMSTIEKDPSGYTVKASNGGDITAKAQTAGYSVYEKNISKIDFWYKGSGWQVGSPLTEYILAKEDVNVSYTEFVLIKEGTTYTIVDEDGTLDNPRLFYKKL